MTFGNGQNGKLPPTAAVVSRSSLMLKRLAGPLTDSGFEVVGLQSLKDFLKHPRQRPFVVCFLDARGVDGRSFTSSCRKGRPGERYVVVREAWNGQDHATEGFFFGALCEAFTERELLSWAERAQNEERQAQHAPPLEDLLYDRFRDFLNHLGPGSMKDLHKLVGERVERPLFAAVMEWSRGNQSKASEVLGIHRNTLRAKLKTLGVSGRLGRDSDE